MCYKGILGISELDKPEELYRQLRSNSNYENVKGFNSLYVEVISITLEIRYYSFRLHKASGFLCTKNCTVFMQTKDLKEKY